MNRIGQTILNFLWPPVENGDYLEAARKRSLIVMSVGVLIAGSFSNFLAFEDVLKRPAGVAAFILIGPYLFMIPPALIRRGTTRLSHVAFIFVALYYSCSGISAFTGGGFFSLGVYYLAAVPPVAIMTLGWRSGLGWFAVVIATYVYLYFGRATLPAYDYSVNVGVIQYWTFVGLALVVTGISIATAVYHNGIAAATRSLVESREQADSGSRAKSEFLANMSHEIRTPLNGVIGMAQALESRNLGPEERAMVETIRDSGNTLLAILNDVLDLSKIESGRTLLSPADDDLHVILQRLQELFQPLARGKGLKLLLKIDDSVPDWVHVDSIRIRQCISNLVSNAVKFTENGGVSVKVSAQALPARHGRPAAYRIGVSVTDTGIGIPPEKLETLFQAFAQADASISRRYGGTGLGLTVARNLAQQMGGDITVKSTPRVGSRFVFTFLADAAESPRQQRENTRQSSGKRIDGVHVFVVDDQPVNRQVARIFLEEAGAMVSEAENGRDALAMLEEMPCDIMLLDIHMPVMDGMETIKRLRAGSIAGKGLPVIALTADAMTGAAAKLIAAGMDDYLAKPVDRGELIKVIRRVLSTKRAVRVTPDQLKKPDPVPVVGSLDG